MRRALTVLAVLLVVASLPAVAAAETRSGGTVTVAAGETVDGDLTAYGGTVVVSGTVDGDLTAYGGTVIIDGTVTGDVKVSGGTVRIAGTVGGNVSASAGSVELAPGGTIEGSLEASAGAITIAGTVGGDVRASGEVRLRSSAEIGGDLIYDGTLSRADGATVAGTVTRKPGLDVGPGGGAPSVPPVVFDVYGVLVNLVAGAVLLLAFPRFSASIADRVADDPLRTGGVGLLALIAIPLALVVVTITIVGIPLALVGALALAVLLWVGALYGRYAVGAWLVSLVDYDNRWAGLLVGVVAVALVRQIPYLGGVARAVVFLLGFGAVVLGLYTGYRSRRSDGESDAGATGADTGAPSADAAE